MSLSKFGGLALTGLRSNFGPLRNPYKLTFSVSYWCQSRCITCNIWQIKPKGELTLDEIKSFAQKNTHFKWIEITGGEPFMRSDIVEIVRTFKENSKGLYIVTIPTNSLCNHDMVIDKIEQMLALGVPSLVITLSLDGYRELHDKIRGVPGNYDRVIDMARRLQALQKKYKSLDFFFGYTISKFNQGQFEETYRRVREDLPGISYNKFHLNLGQVSDIYYANSSMDLSAAREQVAGEIKAYIRNRTRQFGAIPMLETAFYKKLVGYIATDEVPIRSRSLDVSLFMDSYGNVYPSIMWGRKIGNIRESEFSLEPIWNSAEAAEVRTLIRQGKEPKGWTACEAYQTLVGDIKSLL